MPIMSLEQRFWLKVNKTGPCWLWTASQHSEGYGHIRGDKTMRKAHRVSWELHFGAIPDGLFVCHHCDERRCVRPDHLFLGTALSNHRDMSRKGRASGGVRGVNNPLTNVRSSVSVMATRS